MMISPHKTPALAKMAMLLLFAIGAVAVLGTNTISAQELGRTITSPFGIARQTSSTESGSDGDTFIDPETGEVGHIIRNPFGVSNPDGVDTGIDIPDDAGEEVGGIITSPFGVPASDDIDTGVDVFDEDEEYLISLPEDEESDVEDSEDVEEINDEPSDDEKELEDESAEATTEKYVPVIDNPTRGGEYPTITFSLVGTCGGNSVTSERDNPGDSETLFVPAGQQFTVSVHLISGSFPINNPIWTVTADANNPATPLGTTNITSIPIVAGTTSQLFQSSSVWQGNYTISASCILNGCILTRTINIVVWSLRMTIKNPLLPNGSNSPNYASLLITNIGDESTNGHKPDYANFEVRENESSILEVDLDVNIGNLNRNNCIISFNYSGTASIPTPERIMNNDNKLKYILKKSSTDEYWDYLPLKDHHLRVWTSSNLSPITCASKRFPDNYGTTAYGNYLSPADYTISSLFPDTTTSSYSKTLYLEGINPGLKSLNITLTCGNELIATSELLLNIIEGKIILNTNNDPQYNLDDNDYKLKGKNDGFQGWYAEDLKSSSTKEDFMTTYGLENLFPIKMMNLSKVPEGMKYILKFEQGQNGIIIPHPKNDFDEIDFLAYLKECIIANSVKESIDNSSSAYLIPKNTEDKDVFCLFGVYKPSNNLGPEEETTGHMSLYLCFDNSQTTEDGYLLDRAKYTFRPIDKYFEMWSTRQTTLSRIYNCYPIEDGRPLLPLSDFYIYDAPTCLDGDSTGYLSPRPSHATDSNNKTVTFAKDEERDTSKDIFLYIHGFNVTEAYAIDANRTIFRRMYWTGYRGTYVGLTWNGDYNPISWSLLEQPDIERLVCSLYFDEDVFHAFQTSVAICSFIKNELATDNNINIAAHSLGNLLMWEALRLLSCDNDFTRRVNSVTSIEGAVWSESFRDPIPLYYDNEADISNNIIYKYRGVPKCPICQDCSICINCQNCQDIHNPICPNCQNCQICLNRNPIAIAADLEKHSWSHWFRQPEHSALSVVKTFVNSRTEADFALLWMKRWNVLCHDEFNHYSRTHEDYRTPERNSLPSFAALLKSGHRVQSSYSSNGLDTLLSQIEDIWNNLCEIALTMWNSEGEQNEDELEQLLYEVLDTILLYKDNLTDPIGLTNLNNADNDMTLHFSQIENNGERFNLKDCPASEKGWRGTKHSDMLELPFYTINPWYNHIFKEKAEIIP
jgi:hypothetical protein